MFRGIPKGLRNRRAKMILKQVGLDKRMSTSRRRCRAVSSSVWVLPAPLFPSRKLFLPMSRPATWTPDHQRGHGADGPAVPQEQSDAGAGYSRPRAGAVCRPHHHTDRRQGGGHRQSVDCAGGSRRSSAAGAGGGSARFCHPNPRQRKAGREQHKNQHRAGGKRGWLPDQLQKAAPTEQQTVQPQKTEREDGE